MLRSITEEITFLGGTQYTLRRLPENYVPNFIDFVVKLNSYSHFENAFLPYVIQLRNNDVVVIYDRTFEHRLFDNIHKIGQNEVKKFSETLLRFLDYVYLEACAPFVAMSLNDIYTYAGELYLFPPFISTFIESEDVIYSSEFLKYNVCNKSTSAFVIGRVIEKIDKAGLYKDVVRALTNPDAHVRDEFVEKRIQNFIDLDIQSKVLNYLNEINEEFSVIEISTIEKLTYKYNMFYLSKNLKSDMFIRLGNDITNLAREILVKFKDYIDDETYQMFAECVYSNCKFELAVSNLVESLKDKDRVIFEITDYDKSDHLIRKLISTVRASLPKTKVVVLTNKSKNPSITFKISPDNVEKNNNWFKTELSKIDKYISILGESFTIDDVVKLSEVIGADVEENLQKLNQIGLLKSLGKNFFFEPKQRKKIYSSLPRKERVSLHRKLASKYENELNPYNLAFFKSASHFEKSGDFSKALLIYLKVIRWNMYNYVFSPTRIAELINKSEKLLKKIGRKSYALESLRVKFSYLTNEYTKDLAKHSDNLSSNLLKMIAYFKTNNHDKLSKVVEKSLNGRFFERTVACALNLWLRLSNDDISLNDVDNVVRSFKVNSPLTALVKVETLKIGAVIAGKYDKSKAIEYLKDALNISQKFNLKYLLIDVYTLLGLLEENPAFSTTFLRKAIQIANEIGFQSKALTSSIFLLKRLLILGKLEEFERELSNIENNLLTINFDIGMYVEVEWLKSLHWIYTGDFDNAQEFYEGIFEKKMFKNINTSVYVTSDMLFSYVILLLYNGNFEKAKKFFEKYVNFLANQKDNKDNLYRYFEFIKPNHGDLEIVRAILDASEFCSSPGLSEKLDQLYEIIQSYLRENLKDVSFWMKDIVFIITEKFAFEKLKNILDIIKLLEEKTTSLSISLSTIYLKKAEKNIYSKFGDVREKILENEIADLEFEFAENISDKINSVVAKFKDLPSDISLNLAVNFVASTLAEMFNASDIYVNLEDRKSGTDITISTIDDVPGEGTIVSFNPFTVKIFHEIDNLSSFTWFVKSRAFRMNDNSEALNSYVNFIDELFLGKIKALLYKERANKDPLTLLYNRWYMGRYLENLVENYLQRNDIFSVFLIDIDHFKKINDTYGHTVGDDVLRALASLLQEFGKANQITVGRFGGEEFIGVGTIQKDKMVLLCEDLRTKVQNVLSKKFDFGVTVSIGIASVSEESNLTNLLGLADKRLYKAKEFGRNRVFWTD